MFSKSRPLISYLIVFLGFNLSNAYAQNTDEPDLKKENRLHNLYKNFNSKPTSEEVWTGLISGKGQVYSVQEEDTLWDVSETLFGDPKYWPKVWSLNSENILNPHEIFPGQAVQFTPGTVGNAPALAVRDKTELEKAEETEVVASPEHKELLTKAEIPPEPEKKPVGKIPHSMPSWTMGRKNIGLKFEVEPRSRDFAVPEEPLNYYIDNQKVSGMGYVTETEMPGEVASDFQFVYVKLAMPPNEKLVLAVKETGEIKDPLTNSSAFLVQVQGEIEILELVNSAENIYRAQVKKSVNPIEVGAQLIIGEIPKYNTKEEGVGAANARIIGGQNEAHRKMFEYHAVVFLAGQGLQVGQAYPVFKQQPNRNKKTQSFENPRRIGQVKIVRVSDSLATGIVLQSTEEILVGDVTDPNMRSQ